MNGERITEDCMICHGPYHAKGLCRVHYLNTRYHTNKKAKSEQILLSTKWNNNNPNKVKKIQRRFKDKNPNYFKNYWKNYIRH